MLPQENFEFRSSQIASDTIWDKIVVNTCDKTLITISNFKVSGGELHAPPPPHPAVNELNRT